MGTAFIDVNADLGPFFRDLGGLGTELNRRVNLPGINVAADTSAFDSAIRGLRTGLQRLAGAPTIDVAADTTGFKTEVRGLAATVAGLNLPDVNVNADTQPFKTELRSLDAAVAATNLPDVVVNANTAPMHAEVARAAAAVASVNAADIPIDANTAGFTREVDGAAAGATTRFAGIGSTLRGTFAGIGATLATAGIGSLVSSVVSGASDINESLSRNVVLFGRYASGIDRFAQGAAQSMGLSRRAVLNYTGTFGSLFTALGLTQRRSAEMSTSLVELAADMASFNNSTPEEALDAIRSGLVGETEPLRRFGVNMNAATLHSEALRLGLKNVTDTLTPQQQALAATSLITRQTATAHGDFARTSGGLANQQRILTAQFQNGATELGARLLPAALAVVRAFNGLFSLDFSGIINSISRFVTSVVGGGGQASGAISGIGDTVRGLVDIFNGVVDVITGVWTHFGDVIVNQLQVEVRVIAGLFRGIVQIVQGVVDIIAGIFTGDWSRVWDGVKEVVGGALTAIGALLHGVIDTWSNIITVLGRVLGAAFGAMWDGIKTVFGGAITGLVSVITGAFGLFTGAAQGVINAIVGGITSGAAALAGAVSWIVGTIVNGIRGLLADFTNVGDWITSQIMAGLRGAVAWVTGAVAWIVGAVVNGIRGLVADFTNVGDWITNQIMAGLKAAVAWITAAVKSLVGDVVNGIKGLITDFTDVGDWITKTVMAGLKGGISWVTGAAQWVGHNVSNAIHDVVDDFTNVGDWITAKISAGIQGAYDAVAGAARWIGHNLSNAIHDVVDDFTGVGGWIMSKIAAGIDAGYDALKTIVNKILTVINKIPGLPDIPLLAHGGTFGGNIGTPVGGVPGFARGGSFSYNGTQRSGGKVMRPLAVVGEEAPRHPEYVIPTNPAYRSRAVDLFSSLGSELGVPGFAEGGVISDFKRAIADAKASPKEALALWEAGIVESGLRNLPYGDSDSVGALQERVSIYGLAHASDPYASAMRFLRDAHTINARYPNQSAGGLAGLVQRPAPQYLYRYDAVRSEAEQFASGGGGGIVGAVTGAVSGAVDALAGMVSDLIGQLPGIGDLPDWLKGTGTYLINAAKKFIEDQIGNLTHGEVGDLGTGPGNFGIVDALAAQFGLQITSTTGGVHAPGSYHYLGRAKDYSNGWATPGELGFARALVNQMGHSITELIHTPLGFGIKNGQKVDQNAVYGPVLGEHYNHVHVAFRKGGVLDKMTTAALDAPTLPFVGSYATGGVIPQTGMALVHEGETVIPAGAAGDYWQVDVHVDDPSLRNLVKVEIAKAGRHASHQLNAGRIRP